MTAIEVGTPGTLKEARETSLYLEGSPWYQFKDCDQITRTPTTALGNYTVPQTLL